LAPTWLSKFLFASSNFVSQGGVSVSLYPCKTILTISIGTLIFPAFVPFFVCVFVKAGLSAGARFNEPDGFGGICGGAFQ